MKLPDTLSTTALPGSAFVPGITRTFPIQLLGACPVPRVATITPDVALMLTVVLVA